MFIIPFYITEKEIPLGFTMDTAWIFMTHGGKEVWSVDETDCSFIIKEYLDSNNIYGTHIQTTRKDVLLYRVDIEKTKLSDFYTWNDILTGVTCNTEIWRPIFWIRSPTTSCSDTKDEWGWEEEIKELNIGKFGKMDTLWKVLREGALV
jgi:hypothetical protein